jgi:hypothetical protein
MDLALWRKTVEICQECLEMDRRMLARIGPPEEDRGRDAENYLDPRLWEQFIEARQDLVEFTTSSIHVLSSGAGEKLPAGTGGRTAEDERDFAEMSELENRLVTSLKEMVELETRLADYLTENLSVLRETIDGLARNQVLFTQYAKKYNKPEPGYLSSDV